MMISVGVAISAIDIYLPALPLLKSYFGTTEYMMQISIMLTPFVASVVGLFFGRLSDIHGRRPLFLLAIISFVVGSLGCSLAWNIETFFLGRIIQAVGGGGISILAIVIISDLFHGVHYAKYLGIYSTLFPIVFALAPIIGAQFLTHYGWRSLFLLLFILSLYITLTLVKGLPETLEKRNHTEEQGAILNRFALLLKNRIFILMGLGHALPISIPGLFTSNGPFVFIEGFGFSPTSFSLLQAIPIVMSLFSSLLYQHYIVVIGIENAIKIGFIGFLLFGLCSLSAIFGLLPHSPYVLISIMCLCGFSIPFIVASCATRAFEAAADDRGLGVALVALLRNAFLSVAILSVGAFYDGTITPVFSGQFIIVAILLFILASALFRRTEQSVEILAQDQ